MAARMLAVPANGHQGFIAYPNVVSALQATFPFSSLMPENDDLEGKILNFDWVDARSGGQKAPKLGDDDLFDVDLPFEFPFYGKTMMLSRLSRCPSR